MFGTKELNFGLLGALFFIEVRQQHRLLCAEQCPARERCKYHFIIFLCPFSKFF